MGTEKVRYSGACDYFKSMKVGLILEMCSQFYWDKEALNSGTASAVSLFEMHIPNTPGSRPALQPLYFGSCDNVIQYSMYGDRQERCVWLCLNMQVSLNLNIIGYRTISFCSLFIILKELQFSCYISGRLVSMRPCHVALIRKYCPRADVMLMNGSMKWIMPD